MRVRGWARYLANGVPGKPAVSLLPGLLKRVTLSLGKNIRRRR